jgi:Protein of unknown function (DUF721).
MKRTYPRQIGEIINDALDRAGLTEKLDDRRICALWPEVVGQGINRYTIKRFVDHGVMHVYLSSAALKNELSFNRAALVRALNDVVGKEVIHDILFH